ncbi:HupE/UreJ family protein [Psychromonas sp. 14N.309.X.WAT.B.A12]|uniref:HupE/UreJ family protein n=1 Tax=unclassified Psychromonas TaxID=2614957 RepID=UPI0025B0CBE9|nr:HupE/UreJ family protein [Psychromonas sp. 14N.309.X.WAT.B.A12]MDN2662181.1 HupE/UreJ family protein [Psychromonas sp. 14N.309.X.WAT.B.A12]
MKKSVLAILAILLTLPNLAYAHVMPGGGGFMSGFSHPVLGLDHLLAMLSVGILSAQMGGKAIWRVPVTFVIVMLIGGILGIKGVEMFSVELGIAISVLALGISITTEKKLPHFIAMLFVGFFAIFHGFAHGVEMPYLAKPEMYAAGFVVGTATIHIAGVFIALILKRIKQGDQLLRYLGAGIAGVGFHLVMM